MEEVGVVTHYFSKLGVAVVKLEEELKVGDKIQIKGATTDFEQKVNSIQIEQEKLEKADAGQEIGLKVKEIVRKGDKVFKA